MKKIIVFVALAMATLFFGNINAIAEEKEEKSPVCATDPMIISGEIDHSIFSGFVSSILQPCTMKGLKTTILLSSGGGEVSPVISMYDSVELFGDRKNIKIIGVGMIASSAVIAYLSGGERELTPNGSIYLHSITTEVSGSLTLKNMTDKYNGVKGLDDAYAAIIAKETKLTIEEAHDLMDKGTLITAKDAVKYGFAHRIIGEEKN